jgi:hypothetical protein
MLRAILAACLCLSASPSSLAQPAASSQPWLYDVTVETAMPHLDEALRYATTHGQRCLDRQDLSAAFPILEHVSLQDCTLVLRSQQPDGATYALRCTAGHGTTGEARWSFEERRIAGTLSVKLGGKNMTFSQRIYGVPVRSCSQPGRQDELPGQLPDPSRAAALVGD